MTDPATALEVMTTVRDLVELAEKKWTKARQERKDVLYRALASGCDPAALPALLAIPANAETFNAIFGYLMMDDEDAKAEIYATLMVKFFRREFPPGRPPLEILRAVKSLLYLDLEILVNIPRDDSRAMRDLEDPNDDLHRQERRNRLQASLEKRGLIPGAERNFRRLVAEDCLEQYMQSAPTVYLPTTFGKLIIELISEAIPEKSHRAAAG